MPLVSLRKSILTSIYSEFIRNAEDGDNLSSGKVGVILSFLFFRIVYQLIFPIFYSFLTQIYLPEHSEGISMSLDEIASHSIGGYFASKILISIKENG